MDEHLDHEALAELREVMEEDFETLLGTYLNDSRMRISALADAAEAGNPELYARTAHSLKGSCINIGAMRLGQLCAGAERTGRSGDLGGAQKDLQVIQSEFEIVAEQLNSYIHH
ncbi:Hpt domain-containing protein [Hydrocarboniclastica marina]|uniref:Hpt domain-containing protein n=1 Tax=Hydrocarboniclastica marina TaxID=2259620 RepID=A0A4P7XIH5_9ALTE|nr:Hpt domain-containing protein [Hydrocarboniclastica marina]MAL98574.1 histidine kinase [Alteromonadaceae bacterium]QCF25677.1 Hpt domain-containing protein [Hydrocarboniclastica marina]